MKNQKWFIVHQINGYTAMITQNRYEADPTVIEGIQPEIAWIHPDTPDEVVKILNHRLFPRNGYAILITKE